MTELQEAPVVEDLTSFEFAPVLPCEVEWGQPPVVCNERAFAIVVMTCCKSCVYISEACWLRYVVMLVQLPLGVGVVCAFCGAWSLNPSKMVTLVPLRVRS